MISTIGQSAAVLSCSLTPQHEAQVRRVYSYFVFRLRQPEEAERLTRLTFERASQPAQPGHEEETEPDQRLFAAAREVIATQPRRRGASRVASPADQEGDGARGLSSQLAIAIGRLHGRERDALALRFGAELGIGEIAELLDRTPQEVKQRISRGVRGLSELGVLPGKPPGPARSAAKRPRAGGAKGGQPKQRQSRQQRGSDPDPEGPGSGRGTSQPGS
jgi:DNA-directed RNA polymerase specialized sigma24 family protein